MKALKLSALVIAPALVGQVCEPLAWVLLFVLPFMLATAERKGK